MDDDVIALVRQLCTRAGMIMEDGSASAILVGTLDKEALARVVQQTRKDLGRALTLAEAARVMMDLADQCQFHLHYDAQTPD